MIGEFSLSDEMARVEFIVRYIGCGAREDHTAFRNDIRSLVASCIIDVRLLCKVWVLQANS